MNRVLLVLCLFLAGESTAIEIIAHRGYACDASENTVRSVEYAWLAGADGVELDLQASKDGIVFLYHDDDIDGRPVEKINYADIVSPRRPNAPEFQEVLALGEPPGYFILDLKSPEPEAYLSIPSLVSNSGIDASRFVFQSASIGTLVAMKESLPRARYFYISHLKRSFPLFRAPKPRRIIAKIKGLGIDGVSLKGRQFIDARYLEAFSNAGFEVMIWTINDPARGKYYRDIGANGLITDYVESVRSAVLDDVSFEGQCLSGKDDGAH